MLKRISIFIIFIIYTTIPIAIFADNTIRISPSGISFEKTIVKDGKIMVNQHDISKNKYDLFSTDGSLISIDPLGEKAAILKTHLVPQKDGNSEYNLYWLEVVVKDINLNNILVSFENAHMISFSPNGQCIAYSTAYPGQKLAEFYAIKKFQKGVWIYNFNDKTSKKLDTFGVAPIDINWSEHDGNIYIFGYYDNRVYRYNVNTNKGEIHTCPK